MKPPLFTTAALIALASGLTGCNFLLDGSLFRLPTTTVRGRLASGPGIQKDRQKLQADTAYAAVAQTDDGQQIVAQVGEDGTFDFQVDTGKQFMLYLLRDADGDGQPEEFAGSFTIQGSDKVDLIGTNGGVVDLGDVQVPLDPQTTLIELNGELGQIDTDNDGQVDANDNDDDNDGQNDDAELNQLNSDDDSMPNVIDPDDDNDGQLDENDNDDNGDNVSDCDEPDADGDGIPDAEDVDPDNDGQNENNNVHATMMQIRSMSEMT